MVITSIARRWQRLLRRAIHTPLLQLPLQLAGSFLLGFVLSAASLAHAPMPFAMGVLCAGLPGWLPVPFVVGSILGCRTLWLQAGQQAIVWLAAALPVGVVLEKQARRVPLLQPALAALIVSVSGVAFQHWQGDATPIPVYLLRVGLALGSCWCFLRMRANADSPAHWLGQGVLVLSLAQLAPHPYCNLGMLASAAALPNLPFPGAALAGFALDISGITPVPMTAVLCLSHLLRLLPGGRNRKMALAPIFVYLAVMALCGQWDMKPLPALALGSVLGTILPRKLPELPHRGDTGLAQVRLELAAGVLAQSGTLLSQGEDPPIDEQALVERAVLRACTGCPCRKTCEQTDPAAVLGREVLYASLQDGADLPLRCKKRGRMLPELRRSQEQLRLLRSDHRRRQEYRGAVAQQYSFLSSYLQGLADKLPRKAAAGRPVYKVETAVCTAGRGMTNGDRVCSFAGAEDVHYLLLCDGMGTGAAAAQTARETADLLKRMLTAGFPPEFALGSLNSLCALQGRAGLVTVDLLRVQLQTGRGDLYKWGAAPSYLLGKMGPERIGYGAPPPGLSLSEVRETVDHVNLRRGQPLLLLSDGVQPILAEEAMENGQAEPLQSLAARILEAARAGDDATVAALRLLPV